MELPVDSRRPRQERVPRGRVGGGAGLRLRGERGGVLQGAGLGGGLETHGRLEVFDEAAKEALLARLGGARLHPARPFRPQEGSHKLPRRRSSRSSCLTALPSPVSSSSFSPLRLLLVLDGEKGLIICFAQLRPELAQHVGKAVFGVVVILDDGRESRAGSVAKQKRWGLVFERGRQLEVEEPRDDGNSLPQLLHPRLIVDALDVRVELGLDDLVEAEVDEQEGADELRVVGRKLVALDAVAAGVAAVFGRRRRRRSGGGSSSSSSHLSSSSSSSSGLLSAGLSFGAPPLLLLRRARHRPHHEPVAPQEGAAGEHQVSFHHADELLPSLGGRQRRCLFRLFLFFPVQVLHRVPHLTMSSLLVLTIQQCFRTADG